MDMKFKNGATVNIEGLTEQRVGRTNFSWVMMFSIKTQITKEDLELLLTEDNISELEIMDGVNSKIITGYNTVVVATMRYLNDLTTIVEVQLRK